MIETATLITLSLLFLIFFRPGKTPPLEKSLVIERAGRYTLTLAAQLNLAQPFIEGVAARLADFDTRGQSSTTCYFEVRDPQVTAHGFDFYLLACTLRNGIWLFQAARPASIHPEQQYDTLCQFAHGVLAGFPDEETTAPHWAEKIESAVQAEAQTRTSRIKTLAAQ